MPIEYNSQKSFSYLFSVFTDWVVSVILAVDHISLLCPTPSLIAT